MPYADMLEGVSLWIALGVGCALIIACAIMLRREHIKKRRRATWIKK